MAHFNLDDAVVAITGASGDLGRHLCAALAARGARLALMDLDQQSLTAQAETLGDASRARGWVADVRDLEQVRHAMDAAAAHFGRLDLVIANAGVATLEPLAHQSEASFERTIDINLNGVFRTFKAGLPHLRETKGHLLAIASMASFFNSPLQGAYTASKAGVLALCNSVRLEVNQQGVTVGSIHPTFFKTLLADQLTEHPAGRRLYNDNRGLFKLTTVEDVVAATIKAIGRRSQKAVVPKRNLPIAAAPELMRKLTDRLMFGDQKIKAALDHFETSAPVQGDPSS